MSNIYKFGDRVPTDVLIKRLTELSKAIPKGRDTILREFTMRVPAELDRDADLVLSEAAHRLQAFMDALEPNCKSFKTETK